MPQIITIAQQPPGTFAKLDMVSVRLDNDHTGDENIAHYKVRLNDIHGQEVQCIVRGHRRTDGPVVLAWLALGELIARGAAYRYE